MPREVLDARSRRRVTAPDEEYNHFNNARIAAELSRDGVSVQLGAHGQREGLGAHWEMWMLAQGRHDAAWRCCAPPRSTAPATSASTGTSARSRPASSRDLVVLDDNPLADIRNSDHIRLVIQNGRVYDSLTLDQLAPNPHKREPFFWQKDRPSFSFGPSGTAVHVDD